MTAGSASNGASGPAPTSWSCTWSASRSTAVSPSTAAPGSCRTAVTTAAGRGLDPAASANAPPHPARLGHGGGHSGVACLLMRPPPSGRPSAVGPSRRLHSSASGPRPSGVGASPRSRPLHSAGSGRSEPASGSPSDRATSAGLQLAGRRAAHHHRQVVAVHRTRPRRPGPRPRSPAARPARSGSPGRRPAAPARPRRRAGGAGRRRSRPGRGGRRRGSPPSPRWARPSRSSRANESSTRSPRCGRAPSSAGGSTRPSGAGQRGPAQAVHLLPAQDQVEAAAERVGVDQQGAQARRATAVTASPPARMLAPAPPRPPITASTRPVGRVGGAFGEAVDQPGLGRRAARRRVRRRAVRRPPRPRRLGCVGRRSARPRRGGAAGPAGRRRPGRRRPAPAARSGSGGGRRPGRGRRRPRCRPRRRGAAGRRAGRGRR